MTGHARAPRRAVSLIAALLLLSAGCTETDDVVRDIGAAAVILVDPGARTQSIADPLDRIQSSEWTVVQAVLDLDGTPLDLTAGAQCRQADTVFSPPLADGPCSGGLVIDFVAAPRPATLSLTFTMQVRRARPVVLPPTEDGEVPPEAPDGIANDGDGSGTVGDRVCTGGETVGCDDNCPLLFNPDQTDVDNNGIGDACQIIDPFTLGIVRDSDGDGVADGNDNCVWFPNPQQEDTNGPFDGVLDGIGDACQTQTAQVRGPSGATITLDLGPVDLTQVANRANFFVVDLNDRDVLSCDWSGGAPQCVLDPDLVDLCVQPDVFSASLGCP